ncbi:hypothetical protein [Actinomadura madurae]|uniref:hypothetical protein n=1 Tax=Actinomadura madurae TaxID=1993 RepID=UPI0020D254A0|nr:hypothetical protein [Actinomadura madurae]MCQ0016068.1 hypothetical protein [Actinomadura madurae]
MPGAATPATVAASMNSTASTPSDGKLGPDRDHMLEIGEHVAQKWIFERGRDNIRDLLPGPILPPVIDKELLIEAEKTLGSSLRPLPGGPHLAAGRFLGARVPGVRHRHRQVRLAAGARPRNRPRFPPEREHV